MRLRPAGMVTIGALAVGASRWLFASHALFSWDSANFALAMERIDVAAHRPHPPGYLAYVLAGRLLNVFTHDANAALVAWNVIATMLAVWLLARLVAEAATPEERPTAVLAVVAILVTNPLVWFYGEVAEIYASELLCSILVTYCAARAVRGERRWLTLTVGALAVTATFKLFTAVLLLPVVLYAFARADSRTRRQSAGLVAAIALVGLAVAAAITPGLASRAWHFVQSSNWALWMFTEPTTAARVLNRHVRDLLAAAVTGLGVVNAVALVIWALVDRRRPNALPLGLMWLWGIPGLAVFIFVAFAKAGYLLPILPVGIIIVSGFYSRQRRSIAMAIIAAQALVNVAHFTTARPPSQSSMGGAASYRQKPFFQRVATDLQGLASPTAFKIAESDANIANLRALVSSLCAEGRPVIVANLEPIDWRRVMYYLPNAVAVRESEGRITQIATAEEVTSVPDIGIAVHTTCQVVWLVPDEGGLGATPPTANATRVPHLAWLTPAGTFRISPDGLHAVDR